MNEVRIFQDVQPGLDGLRIDLQVASAIVEQDEVVSRSIHFRETQHAIGR